MSDPVISVENLSKSYLIGHDRPQERYHSLRDNVVRHGKNYVRKAVDMARGRQIIQGDSVEEFWALKDVSFEVKQGEVLGIIGRNGAGKSTLLKVLSRITEPTSGRVVLDGRVSSLLEVGTGFHPELTGRENIFLNGAILGMTRAEIKVKFDEIVAFAEVEKFLDTPVKRYSSGMYVRLAFAVAAHLEPEILIIDEVLAVGDAEFQKKCLGKMQDVANGGRTVLFVSHNMGAVQALCDNVVVLQRGNLVGTGPTAKMLNNYLRQQKSHVTRLDGSESIPNRAGSREATFSKVWMGDLEGNSINEVPFGNPFTFNGIVSNHSGHLAHLSIAFAIGKAGGETIFTSHHDDILKINSFDSEVISWRAILDPNVLKPGIYSLHIGLTDRNWKCVDHIPDCMLFEVLSIADIENIKRLDQRPGVIIPPMVTWELKY
jgi:ABC-type polysaccharide/polyol phosphate transport system ATPase subunit